MFSRTIAPCIHLDEVTSLTLFHPGSKTGYREDGLVEVAFLQEDGVDMDIRFIDKDALVAFLRDNSSE
jgi:hypothetical protein